MPSCGEITYTVQINTDSESTTAHATALATVSDSMQWAMDRGDVSLLTLIDLSCCFDVVDHDVLVTQLQLLQIDLGWFRSYLANHQQEVHMSGTNVTSPRPINIGVFQGS